MKILTFFKYRAPLFLVICLLSSLFLEKKAVAQDTISFDPGLQPDSVRKVVCRQPGVVTIYGTSGSQSGFYWQYSLGFQLDWNKISGATSKDYNADPTNYSGNDSVYFRRGRVHLNDTSHSNEVLMLIRNKSNGGNFTIHPAPVCRGDNPPPSAISNYVGEIKYWEKQLSGGGWSIVPGTGLKDTIFLATDIDGTFNYRVIVQNAPCDPVASDTLVFTVKAKPVGYASPSSNNICGGTSVTITLNNQSAQPASYSWTRDQTDQFTGLPTSGSNSQIMGTPVYKNPQPDPKTITFTCFATVNGCVSAPFYSYLTVRDIPVGQAVPSSQAICTGDSATIHLKTNFTSVQPVYSWEKQYQPLVTGIDPGGSSDWIRARPSLTYPEGSAQTVTFKCKASYNGCPSEEFFAEVIVKPFPGKKAITGEFDDLCLQTKPYHISLKKDETVHWELYPGTAGMIANPDDSVAQVAWQKPGKATIAALVSKAGCEKEYSDTVSITDLPEPVDQLVKKAHPSEDTLVILCQLHINETSKDFFYTWGYEKKSNGESIIVSNQGEQCYWAFANPDTIQFLYFVEISYKSKTSCRTRTYYHPVKEVTSAGDHSCLIFPNPSPGIFNITIAHQAKGPFSLTILDARGRMVLVKDYFKEKEVQTFRGISAPLPSSFYILSIRFKSGEEMVTKLVIL